MERNREARRGTMAPATATNGGGGGFPRRRQRNSSSFRDSPEEDGRLEMPDTSRLRDRGVKKDRDRDRSSRSRRRRGERMLHGSNRDRDEGDESSEESMDQDEEDEDEGMSVPVRLPPSSPPLPNPVTASSPQQNQQHSNHHHLHQPLRKSFPSKAVTWKADEMIGVPVPRKARSASTKRAHEPLVTGGGGGGGEHITRQASISPSRLSPASAAQLSPSSSNGSLRKKMKPMSGPKHRPPKSCKSASLCQDEIEIEVAEVLFGMTRQFDSLPKQDSHKMDSRDIDGGSGNEAKSRVSSPGSVSPSPAAYSAVFPSSNSCSNPAPLPTIAPKRKRPRPVKFDEESPTSPVVLPILSSLSVSVAKVEIENQIKLEDSSPISEKNSAAPVKSGGPLVDFPVSQAGLSDVQRHESTKAAKSKIHDLLPMGGSNTGDRVETNEELGVTHPDGDSDVNLCETTAKKNVPQSPDGEKFKFDLMAPPPGKLSPEREDFNVFDPDHKLQGPEIEMAPKLKDKAEEKRPEIAVTKDEHHISKSSEKDTDLRKQAVIKQTFDLQLDLEKPKKEDVGFDKMQTSKQQSKDPKAQEKSASSVHVPLTVGTWPGGFPPYGYMGQVPPLQAAAPINGTTGTSSSLQPPAFLQSLPRPKRCATHCFIAQMISNYQKFARMNSFWTAASGAAPFYGAKPYNNTMVAPSDSALSGHQLQAGFLGANAGTLQDTKGTPVTASSLTGNSASQEKMLQANNNTIVETAQRKQVILQQMPQSGSTSNMPHAPAFIFPISQTQLLQPAATASGAGRVGAAKSATASSSGEVRTSAAMGSAVGSGVAGGSATPVNLSFANMPPNDAQYVAFLQNYGYPFPIPAQFTGAPFRGTSNAQAMPFYYPSHMLHPQLRPQQQQQQGGSLPHVQQSHQNPSALSGSSHKHSQQTTIEFPTTTQRQELMPHQGRPKERSKGMDDNIPSADAAIHAGGHGDKQPIYQQAQQKQSMKVEVAPQAFTIPFASYGGAVSSSTGLDFSMAQNHVILQSLPENSRHAYYQMTSAPVAVTTQATEQKKSNHESEDGKPLARQSMNTNINDDDDRKAVGKGTQHSSFSFAKADTDIAITSVLGNSMNDMSSRQLNLIQPLTSRSSDRPVGTLPVSTSLTATTVSTNSHQQQQHPIHLPKHQQQQMQMQHHLASSRSKSSGAGSSVGVHPESLSGGSTIAMFPHALTGFPQALVQGGSSIQWPQGKSSAGRSVDPAGGSPAPLVKNNFFQLQGRTPQQSLPSQGHQTQISFGINGNKQGGQHLSGVCSSPSPSSATMTVLSPSNSVSRSADGSPRASPSVKPNSQASAILLPPQTAVKQSTSSSSSKINMSNSTMPSMLGHHSQKLTAPSSKQQQQSQQPKQQSSEAQLFFSNPHMQQVQCAQSNASAQYYQKRPSEQTRQAQQKQQHNIVPSTSSMLSLCSPSALAQAGVPPTSDPAKALSGNPLAAANNLKGLPPTSFLNASQLAVTAQSALGSPRPPISATFSYMSLPPFSVKPSADQKPTARTDNLQAYWQPKKEVVYCTETKIRQLMLEGRMLKIGHIGCIRPPCISSEIKPEDSALPNYLLLLQSYGAKV